MKVDNKIQEEAEKVMKMPTVERWRNIKSLLFKIHPDFVDADRLHCEAVADIRNFQQDNEYGSSSSNATIDNARMRHLFKIPTYIWHALATDKEFAHLEKSSDEDDIKTLHKSLWKAFPEYRTARKY